MLIWLYCSQNEVSLSTACKATGSLDIFPLYCKCRERWYPKEKRIYMLYISRYPINITKGKLLKNFNQVTEFVRIKNLSALFSLCSHVCVIASICIYGPNILKHQHSYLKSAVLRLCTRNFYLIKILIYIYIYKRQWIDDRIPRSKQATYFFFNFLKHYIHLSLFFVVVCFFFFVIINLLLLPLE